MQQGLALDSPNHAVVESSVTAHCVAAATASRGSGAEMEFSAPHVVDPHANLGHLHVVPATAGVEVAEASNKERPQSSERNEGHLHLIMRRFEARVKIQLISHATQVR